MPHPNMHRRRVVLALCLSPLAACASRTPKPPLKPNDLRRVGMLPLKEWPDSGMAQFNRGLNPIQPAGILPPPISPSMLGMAIGQAIRNSRNADLAALTDAVAWAKFEPEPTLQRAIRAEFERRSAQIETIDSPPLAHQIREDKLKDLPTHVNAILDVQIHSAGYYAIGRGLGFTPYFQVSARIVDTVNQGEIVDEFSYEGDHTQAKGDSRHFTTPKDLTQPDLAAFQGNAESIRTGLVLVFEQVAAKLVDDIVRVREKQPRLA